MYSNDMIKEEAAKNFSTIRAICFSLRDESGGCKGGLESAA